MTSISLVAFSPSLSGRYRSDGDGSGEAFREDILVPAINAALKIGNRVEVEIDSPLGISGAFLDEAFGGLISKGHFTREQIAQTMIITTREAIMEIFARMAIRYIQKASFSDA